MKAKDLFLLVSMKLQDLGAQDERRWPWEVDPSGQRASLVDFLNAALRQLSLVRPDAFAVTESILLAPGVLQSLPDPAVHQSSLKATVLLDMIRNMGADGATPGRPISMASREALAAYDWSKTGTVVDHFAYDAKENPKKYHVFPGPASNRAVWVEVSYSAEPGSVSTPTSDVPVQDSFAGPLEHWVLYEVYSGDNSTSNMSKAQFHLRAFYDALGIKLQSDRYFVPHQGAVQGAV